ncbi:MAG: 30S ribosomal protein S24e [Methanobacterium sp.]|nr:30S ribosomal protein S24e [Methanobacterium sp.]
MEINITQKTENPLLNRTEIEFECTYQGESTPKILEVKSRLVAVLDVDKNLLVVDKLKPQFGEGKALGYAKLYDSAESLSSIERKHVLEKNQEAVKEEAEEE